MSTLKNCNNIRILLDNIIKRIDIIERQSGHRNLLDIDIARDDVRLVYRELELIKKNIELQGEDVRDTFSHSNTTAPLKKGVADSNEHPVRQVESPTTVNDFKDVASKPEFIVELPVEEKRLNIEPQIRTSKIESTDRATINAEEPSKPEQIFVPKPEIKLPQNHDISKSTGISNKEFSNQAKIDSVAESILQSPKKPVVEKLVVEKQAIGDKFVGNGNSVHERLAKMKEDKSIATKMQLKPIDNLKTAIGVNEKFIYVNELFNGDLKAYNDSIHQLNSCPSIHEAFEFLNQLTTQYNWDDQSLSDTIEKFANLVQRRYMTNG